MNPYEMIQIAVNDIVSEQKGQVNRQDMVQGFYTDLLDGNFEGELLLVEYVKQAKAAGKKVLAVANSEVSKVTREINEERGLHFVEEHDKHAAMKVDLKAEALVVAPTRATKQVRLVELAKLIVKAGTEANVEEAEAILGKLVEMYKLEV